MLAPLPHSTHSGFKSHPQSHIIRLIVVASRSVRALLDQTLGSSTHLLVHSDLSTVTVASLRTFDMTSIYRGDRFDDSKTTVSTHTRRNDDGGYTKVTRYVIRDDDDDVRSNYSSRTKRNDNRGEETIKRVSRREVEEPVRQPRREDSRYLEKDIVIRTREEAEREPVRQSYSWDRKDESDRELIIRRTVERDDSPKRGERELAVSRVEERDERQDYQVASPRGQFQDRDLQHYSRTAEYYGAPQPQTIIIRQDPIIIRERVRDDDYQLVRRSEADEKSVVSRREEPRDEDFFYEKRVRERIDPREYDDRRSRREVSPGDSISQAGRRRKGSYSSDDSMVYVRRVREGYDSRSPSPDRKKNLAAGVIAGVGAAELLRNHHKKEGKETSSGIGRLGRDVGAGALGALAVEGISRARSQYRDRSRRRDSRSRSWSGDRYSHRSRSRGRYRSRSRSRSESRSNLKTLGALGLGAVALAAAATIASKKSKENNEAQKEKRRSRSRNRRGSVESLESLENDPSADDARNPSYRNKRIAGAGAVGAAAAALIERARSRSRARSGERERSKSRVRQGIPIVAAGLGTAALAGLYEKNKAKREAEQIQAEQKKASRGRSRNSSRGRPEAYYDDSVNKSATTLNDPGLIEYGYGPMAGNNYGPGYYGRPPPQEPYSNAVVPAERSARSRSRSMSRDRRGRRSMSLSSGSDAGRKNRRRSRDGLSTEAAAAIGAGAAAGEHERRKAEKKDRKNRRRELH